MKNERMDEGMNEEKKQLNNRSRYMPIQHKKRKAPKRKRKTIDSIHEKKIDGM